jgi:hypothetical protein
MKYKWVFALIAAFAFLMAIFAVLYSNFPIYITPTEHPDLIFSYSNHEVNVTQGGAVSINCTVFNTSYNQSTPKEAFGIQLADINNVSYWENSSSWREIFNQTFTPRTLVLGPREEKTTTLTITLAADAPIGKYDFALQGIQQNLILTVTTKSS